MQKPVKFPHAFLDMVVYIPVVAQRQIPHGPCFFADHRDFPVAVRYQVVDALVVHVVLDMPVVAQRQAGMAQTVQKTLWKYRRCSSCMVVDVPALVRGRPGGASDSCMDKAIKF